MIQIGYCGPEEKYERLGWRKFVEYCAERGYELKYIDLKKPIAQQGDFRAIIQKLTYEIVNGDDEALMNFKEYVNSHPSVRVFDPLESAALTLNREALTKVLNTIQWPQSLDVRIPKSIELDSSDIATINGITKELHFPVLAKPLEACSKDSNHVFRLCTSPDKLVGVPVPTQLQEYINHGGVVYKIYKLGDIIEVTTRKSTRDIEEGEDIQLNFHSQKPDSEKSLWTSSVPSVSIPYDDFQQISDILRESLNMELFGFDILKDADNVYWIVDVNYFPGYKYVENLWEKFFRLIASN